MKDKMFSWSKKKLIHYISLIMGQISYLEDRIIEKTATIRLQKRQIDLLSRKIEFLTIGKNKRNFSSLTKQLNSKRKKNGVI